MPVGRWNGEAWGAVLRMSANPDEPDRVSPRWCGEAESNRRAGHGSEPVRDLPPRIWAIHESPSNRAPFVQASSLSVIARKISASYSGRLLT